MSWWLDKAANLQAGVRGDEAAQAQDYDDEQIRRATVHLREDVVMVVSLLCSVNQQLRTVKLLLAGIACLLIYGLAR